MHSLPISVIFCKAKTDDGWLTEGKDPYKQKEYVINIITIVKGVIASLGASGGREGKNSSRMVRKNHEIFSKSWLFTFFMFQTPNLMFFNRIEFSIFNFKTEIL